MRCSRSRAAQPGERVLHPLGWVRRNSSKCGCKGFLHTFLAHFCQHFCGDFLSFFFGNTPSSKTKRARDGGGGGAWGLGNAAVHESTGHAENEENTTNMPGFTVATTSNANAYCSHASKVWARTQYLDEYLVCVGEGGTGRGVVDGN